jgi:hypothetical protein
MDPLLTRAGGGLRGSAKQNASEQPRLDSVRFLVSILCVRTSQAWRIAALFTTAEKPG